MSDNNFEHTHVRDDSVGGNGGQRAASTQAGSETAAEHLHDMQAGRSVDSYGHSSSRAEETFHYEEKIDRFDYSGLGTQTSSLTNQSVVDDVKMMLKRSLYDPDQRMRRIISMIDDPSKVVIDKTTFVDKKSGLSEWHGPRDEDGLLTDITKAFIHLDLDKYRGYTKKPASVSLSLNPDGSVNSQEQTLERAVFHEFLHALTKTLMGPDGKPLKDANGVDVAEPHHFNNPNEKGLYDGSTQVDSVVSGASHYAAGWDTYNQDQKIYPPVILDLDGNGVQITQLSQSNHFYDTAGDGYQHRTAWAGVGDAVLAFDAQNDWNIDQKNEIVFTEWDKTAKSDMQALRDVFDTNQNGQLDSGDAQFGQFKLMVTKADGTTMLETLAQAGITSINLVENEVEITTPDGSKITGETTFSKTVNGVTTTGTAATVSLATEVQGYALDHTSTPDNTGKIITTDNKQRNADGSIASETLEVYDSNKSLDTTSFDNDGDGIYDRVQTTDRSTANTVIITNSTNTGVLIDKTQTVTNGNTVSISRDLTGQGYFGQGESQVTNADGSVSITITDRTSTSATIDQTVRTTTLDKASGEILGRKETIDRDGVGGIDWTETDNTVINPDTSRTETVTDTAGSATLGTMVSQTATKTTVSTSAGNQVTTKDITTDLDGDGKTDRLSHNVITAHTMTSGTVKTTTTTTDMADHTGDNAALLAHSHTLEIADTNGNDHVTTQDDRDDDGTYDLTTDDNTTVSTGYRTEVVQHLTPGTGGGTILLDSTTTKKYDDGRSRDIQIDSDGDSYNNQTETITLDGSGASIDTVSHWVQNAKHTTATMVDQTITTTTSDGLKVTTTTDADGNTVYETKVVDETAITKGDHTTETISNYRNINSTSGWKDALVGSKTITTTANGLSVTTSVDLDGDTTNDVITKDTTVITPGDTTTNYQVRTVSNYDSDGATLRNQVKTSTSLNKRQIKIETNIDGDTGNVTDQLESIVIDDKTGATTDKSFHYLNNATTYDTIVTTSASKLSVVTYEDWNGDGIVFERTISDLTALKTDGSKVETIATTDSSGHLVNQTIITTNPNGLVKTVQTDVDGDQQTDILASDTTVLNADGSTTRTVETINDDGLISESVTTVSSNKLTTTTQADADGDGVFDSTETDKTAYGLDGTTTGTVTVASADASVRSQTVTVTSADRKTVTVTHSVGGAVVQTDTTAQQSDGSTKETVSSFTPLGVALSTFVTTVSANGLSKTVVTEDSSANPIDTQTDVTAFQNDGSTVETFKEVDGSSNPLATVVETTSANGFTVTDVMTLGSLPVLTTVDQTTLIGDGSKTETITASTTTNPTLYISTVTTSDDGLVTTSQTSLDHNSSNPETYEIYDKVTAGVDGSKTEIQSYHSTAGTLLWSKTTSTDASGHTTTITMDRDGDTTNDWSETVTHNVDGSTTDAIVAGAVFHAAPFQQTTTVAANVEGGTTTTVTDKNGAGTTALDKTIVMVSANKLSTTTQYDTNADSKIDLTETDITTLASDGSTVERDATRYTNGLVATEIDTVHSADGRTVTTTVDNDGNGIFERVITTVTEADGSTVTTQDDFDNKTGKQSAESVQSTSANGLVTTITSGQAAASLYTDTYTRFAGANGSYQWARTSGGQTVATSSHVIDANGIDTWTWTVNNATLWQQASTDAVPANGSVVIDSATEQKYVSIASAIYAAALDRDITGSEVETLGQYIGSTGFNQDGLAAAIAASTEFTTRYSGLGATAQIDAMYMNAFGTLPSATTVSNLYNGVNTWGQIIVGIAQMAAHGQVIRSDVHDGTAFGTVSYVNATGPVAAYLSSPASNTGAAAGDNYFQIDNLIGSSGNDTLVGNADDNIFIGGGGSDAFDGGGGNDTVSYGSSSGPVTVNLSATPAPTASGPDASGDTFTSIENLIGSAGNDTLTGSSGDNVIEGGAGADKLDGGGGSNDTVSYADSSKGVSINLGTGVVSGGDAVGDTISNFQNVTGSAFNDTLTGDGNNNVLTGGSGDDILDGGAGADKFIGGAGNDTVTYADANTASKVGVYVNLNQFATVVAAGGDADGDTFDSVENLTGSAYNDVLYGNEHDNRIEGGKGDDAMYGGSGNDVYVFSRGDGHDEVFDNNGQEYTTVHKLETATLNYGFNYGDYTPHNGTNGTYYTQTTPAPWFDASVKVQDDNIYIDPTAHASAGLDTLEFGAGITAADLVYEFRDNDLYVGVGSKDVANQPPASQLADSIRLVNWVDSLDRVEKVKFADGSSADLAALAPTPPSFSYVDAATATSSSDKLTGSTGSDTLDGGKGDDLLLGGAGNDTYVFGTGYGWDVIDDESVSNIPQTPVGYSSSKFDLTWFYGHYVSKTVGQGKDATQVITWVPNDSQVVHYTDTDYTKETLRTEANAGNDTLSFGAGITIDNIAMQMAGNDLLIGLRDATTQNTDFRALTDRLRVENWNDVNDRIETFKFQNGLTIDVSHFDRLSSGGTGDDVLNGGDTYDWLRGGSGNDTVFGQSGDDWLQGQDGDDMLVGGDGNDKLEGGKGNDKLYGGNGSDWASYTSSAQAVTVNLGTNTASGGDAAGDTFDSIENLEGSGGNDFLTGDGGDNILRGGGGADHLDGGSGGSDTADYSDSTNTSGVTVNLTLATQSSAGTIADGDVLTNIDNLIGSGYNDTLTGDGNANVLIGGVGADKLIGGGGNDTASYATAAAPVAASLATPTSNTGDAAGDTYTGIANLTGSNFDDFLTGDGNANTLIGGAGNDILDGGTGADTLQGGLGDDTYVINGSGDQIIENANEGFDTVQTWYTYAMSANLENMTLLGTSSIGGTGNASDNVITGNSGNNTLDGGTGNDTLIGGDGNDVYKITGSGKKTITELANGGIDTIQSIYSIDLSRIANVENATLLNGTDYNITGNDLNNVLTGNSANNKLNGGLGDDILIGGGGNDTLTGGGGNDTASYIGSSAVTVNLSAGTASGGTSIGTDTLSGIENVTGSSVADTLTGDSNDNVLTGGGGGDVLDGGGGNDTASYAGSTAVTVSLISGATNTGGDAAGDTLTNIENLIGSGGNDFLYGNTGNNVLEGGAGADTIDGGGGAGIDTASYAHSSGAVTVTLASGGTNTGGDAAGDVLTNIANLQGSALDDHLTGNGNDNVLDGGAGNDTLTGGSGNDTYIVDSTGDTAVEAAGGGYDTIKASVTLVLPLANNVEALTLIGTAAINGLGNDLDNVITGNVADNILTGGKGNDTLDGGGGNDTASYAGSSAPVTVSLVTGATNTGGDAAGDTLINIENLTGSSGNDSLTGNSGDNVLDGGGGADLLIGGAGNDTYVVDNTGDTVQETGTDSADTVQSSITFDLSVNGAGIENLILTGTGNLSGTGNSLFNTITGNSGNNTLDGGTGNDTLIGGDGNDVYKITGSGTKTITELANGGTDTIQSIYNIDMSGIANVENATLLNGTDNNITGNAINNVLTGNSGNNLLNGGLGDDTLLGGAGNDTLIGGGGNDTASYAGSAAVTANLQLGTAFLSATNNDTLSGIENLIGSSSNDTLVGDTHDNVLNVGAGGNDVLDGGLGNDTASYANITGGVGVTVSLVSGVATIGGTAAGTLTSIENLTGSNYNDTLIGDSGHNVLSGGTGNDFLQGGDGADQYLFARGGGADTINAVHNDDTGGILAFTGSDIAIDQLWFRMVNADGGGTANDLEIDIIGTSDKVYVDNWLTDSVSQVANPANQLDRVEVAGQYAQVSDIQALVSAMSAFTAPSSTGPTTLDPATESALAPTLAASWHASQ